MNKYLFTIMFLSVFFVSCNQEKINDLNTQISELKTENENLKVEIEILKETDDFYYQSGADEFINHKYENAIDWLTRLKIKFPTSELLPHADKILNESYDNVLPSYVRNHHPNTTQPIISYRDEYADYIRTVLRLERLLGIRLNTMYYRGWAGWTMDTITDSSTGKTIDRMLPRIQLYAENTSGNTLSGYVKISVGYRGINDFYHRESGTLDLSQLNIDGSSKSISLNPGAFMSKVITKQENLSDLPDCIANIYLNDEFYVKIPIQKVQSILLPEAPTWSEMRGY
jgi:hypothetical protein